MPPNDDRAARLKLALRDNLRRRKAQARGRSSEEPAETAPSAPPPTPPGRDRSDP